jgi:hypothetical protein
MTHPTVHTFHGAEELPVRRLYMIGGAYIMLGGNHQPSVTRCQSEGSER